MGIFRKILAGLCLFYLGASCNVKINPYHNFFKTPPIADYAASGATHLILEVEKKYEEDNKEYRYEDFYSYNIATKKAALLLKGHPDARNRLRETLDDLAIFRVSDPESEDSELEIYDLITLDKRFDSNTKNMREGFFGVVKGDSVLFISRNLEKAS